MSCSYQMSLLQYSNKLIHCCMFFLNLEDLCTVCRPAATLLTVFKEIKNPKLRMSILTCLEKVGICRCVSPDVLVTTLLNR